MIKQKKKLIDIVNQTNMKLNQSNVVKKNHILLISISGGQDSICAFFMLLQLKKQWKWSFGLIYCNHLWQKDSFYTSSFIVQLASIFQIPLYCPITSIKIFNEYQSRYWRYDIFYRISFFYNYELVTTGHTSSDKIETILFQLIRGTSTQSLTSLHNVKYFFYINKFSTDNNEIKIKQIYFNNKLKIIKIQKLFHSNYALKILRKKNIQHSIKFNKYKVDKKTISNKITNNSKFSSKTTESGLKSHVKNAMQEKKTLASEKIKLFHMSENPDLIVSQLNHGFFPTMSLSNQRNLQQSSENSDLQDLKNLIFNLKRRVLISKNKPFQDKKVSNKLINSDVNRKPFFLIRPVLYLTRFDVKKIILFLNLPLYPDKSNTKKHYYRNRIRKQLLPTLRFFFNPQIDTTLVQFTEIITSEQLYLYIVVNRLKNEIQARKEFILLNLLKINFHGKNNTHFSLARKKVSLFDMKNSDLKNWIKLSFSSSKLVTQLNISLLFGIPLAIQRKIIKQFLENYTDKQIHFFQIEQIIQVLKKKQTFVCDQKKKSLFNQTFYNFKNGISKRRFTRFKGAENPDLIVKQLNFKSTYESLALDFKSLLLNQIYVNPKSKFFKYKVFALNISSIPVALPINRKPHINSVFLTSFFYRRTCTNQKSLNIRKSECFIGIFKNTKQNIFNFKKLAKTNYRAKNTSYLYLYDKASNNFLNTYYFQKFQIFFYPNVGIIFFFTKKLVCL